MADNNRNWLDSIKKLPGWITGFIAFVTAVVGFVKLLQGDTGLVTTVLLAIGVGGGTLGCAYLAFSHTKPKGRRKRRTWKYPRWRPWALVGLVIIPLLAAGGVIYHRYQKTRPPTKVILLVADFDGPEPQKYCVTKTVYENLSLALEKYHDVQVDRVERTFEKDSNARAEGEKRKAAIVIWGWYGVTAEAVPLSVHFEVLRPPKYMPELRLEARGLVQTMAVAELESFTLQTQLSEEMAYLSLFAVGMARYAAEDWDGAVACFSDALSQTTERMPVLDQSIVHFKRGVAYDQGGDTDRAIADYDQAIQLNTEYFQAYNNRGVAYYAQGDTDRAIADFDQAIKLKPDFAEAYNNRGLAYYAQGDTDRAIADFDQAIQLKPDFAEAYNNGGAAYGQKGDTDRAIADFTLAIQLKPDYALAYNNRGLAYYTQGDTDRAIADYDQAIQLKPDYADAYINRGLAYRAKGDYNRAIADFDQAIQLNPEHFQVYNFDPLIQLNPADFQAYNNPKATYDLSIYDTGAAYATICLPLVVPSYGSGLSNRLNLGSDAYINRGLAYHQQGDYDCAIADYDQAIQLQPDDAGAYALRGLAYLEKGDTDRAIADFDRAIQLQPDFAEAYMRRGLIYMQKGEKEKAIADFEKSLELTDNPDLRQQAEEQLKTLGAR